MNRASRLHSLNFTQKTMSGFSVFSSKRRIGDQRVEKRTKGKSKREVFFHIPYLTARDNMLYNTFPPTYCPSGTNFRSENTGDYRAPDTRHIGKT